MRVDIPKTLLTMEKEFSKIFSDIRIVEGSNKVYFSMTGYKSNMLKNIEMNIIIEKKDITTTTINWSYLTNPNRKLVCEKQSYSSKMMSDVIKVMNFLEFDEKYLESVELIKESETQNELTKEQIAHAEWLKEAFQVRVGSSMYASSSATTGKKSLHGIDYDAINVSLVVY